MAGGGAQERSPGEHLFCDPRVHRVCENATSGIAKFVMLWQLKNGTLEHHEGDQLRSRLVEQAMSALVGFLASDRLMAGLSG